MIIKGYCLIETINGRIGVVLAVNEMDEIKTFIGITNHSDKMESLKHVINFGNTAVLDETIATSLINEQGTREIITI
jgi:hypothetical protein